MDERIKSTYDKIYAELFRIILFGCCLSFLIKNTVYGMGFADCIPEFPIMIGSPIYLLIRGRMLGVTQPLPPAGKFKRNLKISLVTSLILSLFVFRMVLQNRGKDMAWDDLTGFALSFVICFVLAHIGFRKWGEYQQKKLDDKYGDS